MPNPGRGHRRIGPSAQPVRRRLLARASPARHSLRPSPMAWVIAHLAWSLPPVLREGGQARENSGLPHRRPNLATARVRDHRRLRAALVDVGELAAAGSFETARKRFGAFRVNLNDIWSRTKDSSALREQPEAREVPRSRSPEPPEHSGADRAGLGTALPGEREPPSADAGSAGEADPRERGSAAPVDPWLISRSTRSAGDCTESCSFSSAPFNPRLHRLRPRWQRRPQLSTRAPVRPP